MNRRSFLNKTSTLAVVAIATPTALLTQILKPKVPDRPGLIYYLENITHIKPIPFKIGWTEAEFYAMIQELWYDRVPTKERKLVLYI